MVLDEHCYPKLLPGTQHIHCILLGGMLTTLPACTPACRSLRATAPLTTLASSTSCFFFSKPSRALLPFWGLPPFLAQTIDRWRRLVRAVHSPRCICSAIPLPRVHSDATAIGSEGTTSLCQATLQPPHYAKHCNSNICYRFACRLEVSPVLVLKTYGGGRFTSGSSASSYTAF